MAVLGVQLVLSATSPAQLAAQAVPAVMVFQVATAAMVVMLTLPAAGLLVHIQARTPVPVAMAVMQQPVMLARAATAGRQRPKAFFRGLTGVMVEPVEAPCLALGALAETVVLQRLLAAIRRHTAVMAALAAVPSPA